MEFRYILYFSYPKYPNSIWIQKLRILYKYFNYRPKPIWIRKRPICTRDEPTGTKNLEVTIEDKWLGPKFPESVKNQTRLKDPNVQVYLFILINILKLIVL